MAYIAPSLGGTESLIEQPTIVSYWDQVRPPPPPPCCASNAMMLYRHWLHACAAVAAGLPPANLQRGA